MKGLQQLIRLHRFHLDERRRELADLHRLAENVEASKKQLEDEHLREKDAVRASPESSYTYAAYARSVIERRQKMDETLNGIRREIEMANERMRDAFRELKKYELMEGHRLREIRAQQDKMEQNMLDELGVDMFRRRGERA